MSTKKNVKIAIIGAGPAGLTAGYELSKTFKHVDIYEAGNSVGGMAKTIELWKQKVDIGPHRFFSTDQRVNKLWLEVVGKDYRMVNRLTRIYYDGNFYDYPLKALNVIKQIGFVSAVTCIFFYLKERIRRKKEFNTFEGWVINRFGSRLYDIFFKTYTEKLWGIPGDMLDSDFAKQRIKNFSLGEALKTVVFGNRFNHKTLVEEFAYPIQGTGMLYERMSDKIKSRGARIMLGTPIKRVLTKDNEAIGLELEDGKIKKYDSIISTMPLSLLVKSLPNVPDSILSNTRRLKFRNTIIIYLNIQSDDIFPDNWLYVHSKNLKMGRITNFRNWVPELYGEEKSTICAIEYWCNDSDNIWHWNDKKLISLATREIRSTGLIKNTRISAGHVYRVNKCYPIYTKGYKELLEPVVNYLSSIKNLYVIGRYGSFKYNNQDHSILMGILTAENIAKGKSHKLWDINTDYDNYQERSSITTGGLKKHVN